MNFKTQTTLFSFMKPIEKKHARGEAVSEEKEEKKPRPSTPASPSKPHLPPTKCNRLGCFGQSTDKAGDLENLKERCRKNLRCPLKETAKNLVFGDGNPNAQVLFIGEAPGEQEDRTGVPFVGPAGKYLDRLLASCGLRRGDIYIANILKYRPPNNRDPKPQEVKDHTPFLLDQIRPASPSRGTNKVFLGTTRCARSCLRRHVRALYSALTGGCACGLQVAGITSLHGTFQQVALDGGSLRATVFPVYHPAAVLHNPDYKTGLETDFQHLHQWVQTAAGPTEEAEHEDPEDEDERALLEAERAASAPHAAPGATPDSTTPPPPAGAAPPPAGAAPPPAGAAPPPAGAAPPPAGAAPPPAGAAPPPAGAAPPPAGAAPPPTALQPPEGSDGGPDSDATQDLEEAPQPQSPPAPDQPTETEAPATTERLPSTPGQ
ncbi:putative uracil-DNA glycosylase [Paratrimastix pyriformis]|uniref:Type-4 uracil-DNA glycosylase n=1 Tax=Paratrimastix pyriformis TaxID=342808 RepID=A0ABQ8UA58_9EUKA|nr:putative uracil-DNA glycosylase [Paratrimastix pyriformis]